RTSVRDQVSLPAQALVAAHREHGPGGRTRQTFARGVLCARTPFLAGTTYGDREGGFAPAFESYGEYRKRGTASARGRNSSRSRAGCRASGHRHFRQLERSVGMHYGGSSSRSAAGSYWNHRGRWHITTRGGFHYRRSH